MSKLRELESLCLSRYHQYTSREHGNLIRYGGWRGGKQQARDNKFNVFSLRRPCAALSSSPGSSDNLIFVHSANLIHQEIHRVLRTENWFFEALFEGFRSWKWKRSISPKELMKIEYIQVVFCFNFIDEESLAFENFPGKHLEKKNSFESLSFMTL